MNRLLEGALNTFFPERFNCFMCDKEAFVDAGGLCPSCAKKLCRCSSPANLEGLDGIAARWRFDDLTAQAVHRLKYSGAKYLCRPFTSGIKLPENWAPDAIVPVPLHKKRQRARGYNQSALLAKELGALTGIPVREDLLKRVTDSKSQTRLTPAEREKNMRGAFAASADASGLTLLLLDDVLTTGCTVKACARALKSAGARGVYAYCIFIHPILM
ncbi:MAG: phosphoribosyltransferase family protein [Bacillota bacterium]